MRFYCSTHLSLLPSSYTSLQCSLPEAAPPLVCLQVPGPSSPMLPALPRSRGGTMPSAPHTLTTLARHSVPLPCRARMYVFLFPPPKVLQVKYFCPRSSIPAILLRHGCAPGAPTAAPGMLAPHTISLAPLHLLPCHCTLIYRPVPYCQLLDLPLPEALCHPPSPFLEPALLSSSHAGSFSSLS